jgi:ribosomal protein L7/L12
MSRLGCEEVLPHLESYHQGDASSELTVLLDDHLARCPECRRRLAHLKQVSAMLAAWRPRRVPVDLKVETAETVGEPLGLAARQVFAPGRLAARPRKRRESPLTHAQRMANTLALAALLVLGGAIVYKVWIADAVSPSRPPAAETADKQRFRVLLRSIEQEGATEADLAERRRRAAEAIHAATGLPLEEIQEKIRRAPTALCNFARREEAEALRETLRQANIQTESIDMTTGKSANTQPSSE